MEVGIHSLCQLTPILYQQRLSEREEKAWRRGALSTQGKFLRGSTSDSDMQLPVENTVIPLSDWSEISPRDTTTMEFTLADNSRDTTINTIPLLGNWSAAISTYDILYAMTEFPMDDNNSSSNTSMRMSTISSSPPGGWSAVLTTPKMKNVYWLICCFGFLSNVFVVLVISFYKPMRKQTTNLLIINQSIMDATVAVFLFFTTLYENDDAQTMRVRGQLEDELLCRLWFTKMPLWGTLVSSMYAMVTLTLERFLAVVYPIWHKTKFSRNRVLVGLMIGVPWLFGPLFYICLVTPTAKITSDGHCTVYSVWPDTVTQRLVGVITVVIQFLTPLTILVYCYTRMALVLHQKVDKQTTAEATKGQQQQRNESMARARGNVIRTLTIIGVCCVLCWSWNQGYYLLFQIGCLNLDFTGDFYSFTVIAVFMNCCTNPIIYTVGYRQFQRGVRRLVCRGRVEDEGNKGTFVDAVTDTTK